MAPREELPFVVKHSIVQQLARYLTPTAVQKAVKAEFGLELSLQRISFYDPTTKAGKALAADLQKLFAEARAKFLAGIEDIGISHQAVRLAMLDRMANAAEARGNMGMAAQLLEQAAKERGDAFTNARKVDLSGKIDVVSQLLSEIDGEGRKLPEPKKED